MEAEAVFTVQQVAATGFLLYMCKLCRLPDYPYNPSDSALHSPLCHRYCQQDLLKCFHNKRVAPILHT